MAPPPARPRRLTRYVIALATVAAGVMVSLVPVAPALASPTIAELKAEIEAKNRALEPIIEQYNGIRVKLAQDKAKQKKVKAALGPLQLQAAIAQERLGDIARTFYQTGKITPAESLFATKDTNNLLFVMGALDEVARQQVIAVADATQVVADYKSKAAKLNTLIAQEKQQYADLSARKTKIIAEMARLQKLLDQVNASFKYTKSQLMPAPCPAASTGKGHTAAVKACSLVWDESRDPPWRMYQWAAAGPNTYDCSGLTMAAWEAAGIKLAHYTGSQWNESYAISSSQLRPGDLVFYFETHSHVALYVGGGWIVQAEETGQPLKMSHVDFTGPRYYRRVNGT